VDPLVEIVDGVVVEEDLVAITMVIDSDGGAGSPETALKRNTLLGAPVAGRGPGVEDDCVLGPADGDVEHLVAANIEVDERVIELTGTGGRGGQVQRGGLKDHDAVGFEFLLQLTGLVLIEEIEHGDRMLRTLISGVSKKIVSDTVKRGFTGLHMPSAVVGISRCLFVLGTVLVVCRVDIELESNGEARLKMQWPPFIQTDGHTDRWWQSYFRLWPCRD
jgi:hypothetical protein